MISKIWSGNIIAILNSIKKNNKKTPAKISKTPVIIDKVIVFSLSLIILTPSKILNTPKVNILTIIENSIILFRKKIEEISKIPKMMFDINIINP